YKTRDIVKTRLSVEIKVLRDLMKMINFSFKASRVIEFGDSYQAPPEESGTGLASETSAKKKGRTVAITTEDMQKRRNDVKARKNLLLALPDEHQLRFSKLQAIVSHLEFMNVEIEQDNLNQKFLTSLAPEWLMYTIVWRNRDDLDTISLDGIYNHLKVYEPEVQKKSELNSQNMAFISSANTNSRKAASISHDTVCAYIASQSNGSQIKYEDITHIDKDDIEEMNINQRWSASVATRWVISLGSVEHPGAKIGVEEKATNKRYMANEEENHALVADDEAPTEFALMAKSSSSSENEVFDDSFCSKSCRKNTDSLNTKITNLNEALSDSTMRFGNDQFEPIIRYGDLVQGNITIKRVYYVEELNHNLFFVGQFCDADLEVAFRKSTCFVRDLYGNYLLTEVASESSVKKKGMTVVITTEDMQKRKNDVKARTTLLLALPDEHQLRFSMYETVKELWEAILKTFGGNKATKKTKKNQLKQRYGNFKAEGSETLEKTFNILQPLECRALRSQDRGRRENYKQGSKEEEPAPKALMAIDGKNSDSLNTKINKLNDELSDSENTSYHYKLGLSQVEARHVEFKTQEIKFCEKIRGLELDVEFKNNKIEHLLNELEKVKKEKEGLDSKLTGFKSASKDLDTLLGSQRTDKNKEGLGYSVFPLLLLKSTLLPRKICLGLDCLNLQMILLLTIGNSQNNIDDKGYWDSGCSRHMTGNISYLSKYEPYNGGYVSFGQGGVKITAHMESSNNDAQDACNTDAPESSGISNPIDTSKSPPAEQMESLTVESTIPTVSSPVLTACLDTSPGTTSDTIRVEADLSNMESSIPASPTPTLRIHKDHPKSQIIGLVDTPVQTRHKSKEMEKHSFIAIIHQKTNPDLLQFCLFSCFLSYEEPKKISNAFKDPSWVESMQEELLQFRIQNVWILVDCPKGVRPIGIKWVLRNKKDEREIVIRNKARLVSHGHTQEEGIDYEEFFAPVARIEAIRLFLAYASFMGFTVYQMDVKSSFLYGTIDEEPLGFQDPEFPDRVYKVEKQCMDFIRLLEPGMHRGDFLPVQVYVDDIIFGSSNLQLCKEFEALMYEKFQMSVMGELNFFLGLQVLQKKDGIFLSQDKYVGDILKKFGYSDVRSMIESLMYLTASRPDIMFAICACARHQVIPKECHLHAVKRIFRYLKDSDYGGATQDRKLTTRGCQFLGRRLISWQCKKQTIMATSTTEAEYVAAIVDFVEASHIRYALTINPIVYVSHNRQFWSTTKIETTNEGKKILANVDGKPRTIYESLIRRNLKLNDEDGISSLPDVFTNLRVNSPSFSGRTVPLFDSMLVTHGEGSTILTEPHHTPSPQTSQSPHHDPLSPSYPTVSTETIPTTIPIKILTLRQYSGRATRIAQSKALPTAADEPASLLRDDSQGEAFPTVFGLDVGQDRENIIKTSALPHNSTPGVTSLDADEGSMRQKLQELIDLCTGLQRQQTEMASKIKAQDLEISSLKARIKLLEDKDRGCAELSGDDAPITGRSMEIGEEVEVERSTEQGSNDTKELVNVLTSMDAANILTSGVQAVSVPPVVEVSTVGVPTVSGLVPTVSAIFTTASVVTLYSRRPREISAKEKGKEKMVESDTPKKKKLQEQIDAQVAKEMEEEIARDNQRMNE
nr:hypothetical protein [Tanacetum cinerariifolium]